MSVDFQDDPFERFWWAQVPCPHCDEREVSRSFRPGDPFVCLACGKPVSAADLTRADACD